jgi:C-terminal processing protease CtpA/Prc
VAVRFVENRPVVAGYLGKPQTDLRPGDAIEEMDGQPVDTLVATWKPYYADSNGAAQLRDIGRQMTRGSCGDMTMRVRRGNEVLALKTARVPIAVADLQDANRHDLPGDTFRKLSDEVAYLKLSSVKTAEAAHYIDAAAGTKGLIIDIRNYPSEPVMFTLGQLLVDQPTPFARFTAADLSNPGAFRWGGESTMLTPKQPHYTGKVVILVDEVSQSQAEYTTMAFRAAPGAKVVGSTTAGADGDVSAIPLPGGVRSRIGILPDLQSKPTIAGIRAGRDEVLEQAIRQILGREVTPEELQHMLGQ